MMKRKENVLSRAHLLIVVLVLGLVASRCVSANLQGDQSGAGSENIALPDGGDLAAELSAPETIPLCAPVKVAFTVTNQGDQAVYLLTWYTPLEGVLGDIFKVTHQGKELAYQGPMVMRAAPLPEQYIQLGVGESETVVVGLSDAYDVTKPGKYTIAYRSPFISDVAHNESDFADAVDELGPVRIVSSPITLKIVSSEGESECSRGDNFSPPPQEIQGGEILEIKGVVMDVSLSAKVIMLQEEVGGISSIGLVDDSRIVSEDGSRFDLRDIRNGMVISVSGHPGDNGGLLASRIIVHD